jgi:hypothetical protein
MQPVLDRREIFEGAWVLGKELGDTHVTHVGGPYTGAASDPMTKE